MTKNNIAKNYIYNVLYKIFSLLAPLITAPYLARIIGSKGVGIFSFTYAIAYNFSLIAKLGLINYGSRSIAKVKDDKKKLSKIFLEIYYLQIITSIFASILYICYILFLAENFKNILWINILYVIGIAIDIDWLFYGLENFKKIALRNMFVKILTFFMIIFFIKTENDLKKYIFIMGLSEFFRYAFVWIDLKKYINFMRIDYKNIFQHFKPIFILFIPVIATSIYRTMDKIMLGALSTMSETGIYENSEKIIYMLLGFVTSLEMVMMPRISNLLENNKEMEVYEKISKSMIFVMALTSGMAFGIIGIKDIFIPIFYGDEFKKCTELLPGLAITLCFIGWANVIRTQYIVPKGRDSIYVISTLIGAAINLIVNLIFIPLMGAKGAVIGTIFAELSVAIFLSYVVRKELPIKIYLKNSLIYIFFGILMSILVNYLGNLLSKNIITILIQIIVGIVFYFILSIIYLKKTQKEIYEFLIDSCKKLKRRKNDI